MAAKLWNRLPQPGFSLGNRHASAQRGVTLVEVTLVTGMIAVIVLASMMTLNVTLEQRRVNQAIVDVVSVYTAVTKWSNGGVVYYGVIPADPPEDDPEPDPRNLQKWSQIAPLLPPSLRDLADDQDTLRIITANPWGGDYEIRVPGEDMPAVWTLVLHDVPSKAAGSMATRLINSDHDGEVAHDNLEQEDVEVRITYGG